MQAVQRSNEQHVPVPLALEVSSVKSVTSWLPSELKLKAPLLKVMSEGWKPCAVSVVRTYVSQRVIR